MGDVDHGGPDEESGGEEEEEHVALDLEQGLHHEHARMGGLVSAFRHPSHWTARIQ